MKTKLTFLFAAILVITNVMAKPINQSEAMTIAKDFFTFNEKGSTMRVPANVNYQLVYTAKDENQQNTFYVYNLGGNGGFIIVSADTRTKSVLGYSDSGRFDSSRMPANLKEWLDGYSEEIKYAVEKLPESEITSIPKARKVSNSTSAINPLLGSIIYDQDAPYNDSCPKISGTNTVTGCVATAMVQVMRYHKWPVTGTGTKTYTPTKVGTPITANFGATTYDWANMPAFYDNTENTTQKAAIAKLMLHAGVSVDMNYDLAANGGSGAVTAKCANAMYTYFDYDAGIQTYSRSYFTETAWISKLKTELNANRPILYSGSNSSNAGHAFVCDGFDANNMFHFNWGWSGMSNGYYELSALNPAAQGIGSSNGGYNFNQGIITGIQKPVVGSKNGYIMGVDSIKTNVTSIARDGGVNLTFYKVFNIGGYTIPSCVLVYVLTQSGQPDIQIMGANAGSVPMGYGINSYTFDNVIFDASIPNGTYQLKLAYPDENDNLIPALAKNKGFNSIDVTITDANITFGTPNVKPQLQLTAAPTIQNNLYQSKTGVFNFSISNSGTYEYDAQIGVRLVKTDDPNTKQDVVTGLQHINPGETLNIQMSGTLTLAPGNYFVQIYHDASNSAASTFPTVQLGTGALVPTVTIAATPAAPALSTVAMNMPATVTLGEEFTLAASVKNTGGFYDGQLAAVVFNGTSYAYESQFGHQTPYIETNITKPLNFTGALYGLQPGQNYIVALFNGNTQISNGKTFTVINPVPTKLENRQDNTFRVVNPVKDKIQISLPEGVETIYIYNVQGKTVKIINAAKCTFVSAPAADLQQGIYLIKAVGKNINLTAKMIKQ